MNIVSFHPSVQIWQQRNIRTDRKIVQFKKKKKSGPITRENANTDNYGMDVNRCLGWD